MSLQPLESAYQPFVVFLVDDLINSRQSSGAHAGVAPA